MAKNRMKMVYKLSLEVKIARKCMHQESQLQVPFIYCWVMLSCQVNLSFFPLYLGRLIMNNTIHDNSYLFNEVPWMVVYIFEVVLILSGDSITVYIFWKIRERVKRASYLLINLAVADILVGISIIFYLYQSGIALLTDTKPSKL